MRIEQQHIRIDGGLLSARLVEPLTGVPAALFIHGWGGSQKRDTERAKMLAQLGFVCLTFDLRGHGASTSDLRHVSREDNLRDICKAYDSLVARPQVDRDSIAVLGSSYGAYLAAILTSLRPVRWLGLRVPALYRDADWLKPKAYLDRDDLASYRSSLVAFEQNRALDACSSFTGDVLIVESEHDDLVPHATVSSYMRAFLRAKSLTYRMIDGADHALSTEESRKAYVTLLTRWIREMIFGAR